MSAALRRTPDRSDIRNVAGKTRDTYAVCNNHHLGKAVVNGLEIMTLLGGKPVAAPAPLLAHYPALKAFAEAR